MPYRGNPVTQPFIKRLESVISLSEIEKEAIANLPVRTTEIKGDQDIVREGDRPTRMCFIVEGVCCSYKIVSESKRQIVNFHVPGDAPDLQSVHLAVLDISIATITPCRVAFVQHEAILQLCEQHPNITRAFWRHTLIDAAIYREWMSSIGRRPAPVRIAHLLCELFLRLSALSLNESFRIDFPITQNEIGDALGISTVHVNRSLQALRRKNLIALKDGTLEILDWSGLRRAGDFSPEYLQLRPSVPESAVAAQ
jgi:CRP-like cAMP-binding protein